MTPHQLSSIAIRLFVLWFVIFLLRELPASFIAELEQTGAIAPTKIGVAVVLVLLGFVLWFGAGFLARFLVPRTVAQASLPWTESGALTVGSSLIGLWVISYALYPILYYGTLWFMWGGTSQWQTGHTVSLVSALAALAIGVWLFLGARGLWQVWARLRGRTENQSF